MIHEIRQAYIGGVDKARLLAALYNRAYPPSSSMWSIYVADGPEEMTPEIAARALIRGDDLASGLKTRPPGLFFGHLFGRYLHVNLTKDVLTTAMFNARHGAFAFETVLSELRDQIHAKKTARPQLPKRER